MSIPKHIREHAALGIYPLEVNLLTVGAGGRFADIDTALAYIETVTPMVQVAGTAGTVSATAYTDKVTGSGTNFMSKVQAGDLIKIAGDGIAPYTFLKQNIYFPIYGDITTDTKLTLATGFIGVTGAGKAYSIWRPEKYVILLSAGTHKITGNYSPPEGINLSIIGISKTNCILEIANTSNSGIYQQRAGYLSIDNLTIARNINGAKPLIDIDDLLDAAYVNFNLSNIILSDTSVGLGNLFFLRTCNCHISNITGTVFGGLGGFDCDELFVNNLNFRAYNGSADVLVFGDCAFGIPAALHAKTKTKSLVDITVDRELAYTLGAGALVEVQGLNANRIVDLSGITIRDHDQGGSSNPHCLILNCDGGNGVFNLRNAIIQEGNAALNEGGIIANTATDNIYLYGVYGDAGAAVTTEGAATFTKVY